jgi:hypothetical protein
MKYHILYFCARNSEKCLKILKITQNSEQILNIAENSEQILNIAENSEQILKILKINENSEQDVASTFEKRVPRKLIASVVNMFDSCQVR